MNKPTDSEHRVENYADLRELWQLGVLQEANRLFFHPLGLAMVWEVGDDKEPKILGLLDARDDPEGWIFTDLRSPECAQKSYDVQQLRRRFELARKAKLGSSIQPLGSCLETLKGGVTKCTTR